MGKYCSVAFDIVVFITVYYFTEACAKITNEEGGISLRIEVAQIV
jgi:hypothetical protein